MTRRQVLLVVGAIIGAAIAPVCWSVTAETASPAERLPTPVRVINFPNPQPVAGTVNVGNLPAVQQVDIQNPTLPVTGTLSVSNLPLDDQGNLRVSPGTSLPKTKVIDTGVLTLDSQAGAQPNAGRRSCNE